MLTYGEFVEAASKINYQYRHPEFLYALVKWTRPCTVVEVGTHIGMSAVWMARGLQETLVGSKLCRLYCIDPFCWVEEPQEALWNAAVDSCGVRDVVELIKGRSQEVEWPLAVDMAFIDGNHVYEVCKHDAEKARSLHAKVIAIHDSVAWEGSRRYADEMRATWQGWDFVEENVDCGLLVAKRREERPECWGHDIGEKWDKPT